MQSSDEQSLIESARGGDRDAFAVLVERYWVRIYRWMHGLCERTHLAEDLTQDVFLKAWSALTQFQPGTSFRAWLFRIAGNALVDSHRRRRRTTPSPLPETLTASDPGPVQTLLGQECHTMVQQAIGRLPPTLRGTFLLRTVEELSHTEIAEALGITEETARWRLFKARQLLLKDLGSYLDEKA